MAGSLIGGKKAATTNKERHGENFYRVIGKIGGSKGHTGGFYADRERAARAGRIGGLKSRRNKDV
jgi:general stress protein YciG